MASGRSKYCSDRCKVAYNRSKSVTDVTEKTVTSKTVTNSTSAIPNYGLADCQCNACQCNESKPPAKRLTINHGPHKSHSELMDNEVNRVSVPGEPDYRGVMVA
jgi:hypothetical protein